MSSKYISKEDILIFLASMGVELSKNTKMPMEDLTKRLGNALDASQQFDQLLGTKTVDPAEFPKWPGGDILKASHRNNIQESFTGTGATSQRKKGPLSAKEDTFRELRQSILAISHCCDEGTKDIYYMDGDEKWAIFVRILRVYKIKNDVPLFLFVYRQLVANPSSPMETQMQSFPAESRATIKVSELERRILLRLFEKNAKRLPPTYSIADGTDGAIASFVLPLCPIGMLGLGKLTANPGCEVCGKKTTSRCMQCLSVVYCGKECQTADWKTHKSTCRSLKGGSWHKIKVNSPGAQLPYSFILSRLDPTQGGGKDTVSDGTPPPDIHEGKVFLAKFQLSLSSNAIPGHMLIYDRTRSFQLFWLRKSDPDLFDEGVYMMRDKLKFYRWVRRTGDYEFDLCLDRAPAADPVW
ncbi:hypothetical protein M413DRAFT_447013 [Hebeloma cylindrosporum]|uniref:MYND-type domain-containing protein n=1 Tax=Hebeloma cylindrosporum TaxID=76867 RepID=A0A0C3C5I3_HEBCY|nr:hypothetical protein M413DRAFT_447013 [Hebeloma cylindrosporum h7]